jgi:predicted branched-subunit amino acid permease
VKPKTDTLEVMKYTVNDFTSGIKDGIPICLGYFSVSFAFGIFCIAHGLKPYQALLISMTNVTSAGQLAGVPVMTAALPLIEMALTQLVINLRYALMSVSLSQKLDSSVTTVHRMIISFVNTDEVFAVASGRSDTLGKNYLYGLIIMPYLGWSCGTILGAVAGNILPQRITDALGIAIYGMFIAIILPPAKKNRAVLGVVLLSIVLSCLFFYLPYLNKVSSGFVIIICAVFVSALFSFIAPLSYETTAINSGEDKNAGF